MNTTNERWYYRYKELQKDREELKERMLNQIRHLLLENEQLKKEMEQTRKYYSDLTAQVIHSPACYNSLDVVK